MSGKEQNKKSVLVIGDPMLDSYIVLKTLGLSPEAPVPKLESVGTFNRIGGAGNVARNICAFGLDSDLVYPIDSADTYEGKNNTETLRKMLLEENVNLLLADIKYPVPVKTRLITEENAHICRIDKDPVFSMNTNDIERLERIICSTNCQSIVVADYAKGMLDKPLLKKIINCHDRVYVDPSAKRNLKDYSGAYFLTPNSAEAKLLLKPYAVCSLPKLLEKLNISYMLVTSGKNGAILIGKSGIRETIKTDYIQTTDVTGAGDVVIATIAAINPSDDKQAVYAAMSACKLATESVKAMGTVRIKIKNEVEKND